MSAAALQSNFHAIQAQVPGQELLPMIKADAYGHGALWCARMLVDLPGLRGFGVATLEEGAEIRRGLGGRGRRTRILVASGGAPWNESKGQFCERHGLVPVIGTLEDWRRFQKQGWPERIDYELKFNSGMNRLGIDFDAVPQIVKSLKGLPITSHPTGVLTHLATSENPKHPLSQVQIDRFLSLRSQLASVLPSARFHIANSGAIWNHKYWRVRDLTDIVRPGLSLYGIPPWPNAPQRNLVAVMTLEAQVIAIQSLKAGESVGYGATFSVPGRAGAAPVRIAILSAGYADGVHRRLSNKGFVWLNGQESRFVGTISMDLSAVRAFKETRVGDFAQLLGPDVDPWAQAAQAETIPYELLTSVSSRVERNYVR